jgi:hypothetical protein
MGLLERLADGVFDARRATHKRRTKSDESSEARLAPSLQAVPPERIRRRRQPGGVVEVSAVRRDRRGLREHPPKRSLRESEEL